MADYKAPLRDMRFVLNEVFEVAKLWAELPSLAETVDAETVEAILEEAGKLSAEVIAPLNRAGDEQGCTWNNGQVTTAGETHRVGVFSRADWERWLELCARIDGFPRHLSIHSGGMLVTAAPLIDIAPLERATIERWGLVQRA